MAHERSRKGIATYGMTAESRMSGCVSSNASSSAGATCSHRVREAVELKANTRRGGEGYLVSLVFYQLLEAIDHKEEPILVYVAEVSRPQPPL